MPAMMMTLMFYTCTYRYLATGPMYPHEVGDAEGCRLNWWVDLLMVHNFVRKENMVSLREMCDAGGTPSMYTRLANGVGQRGQFTI